MDQNSENASGGESPREAGFRGLSDSQVLARRAVFGENTLPGEAGVSVFRIILSQLRSPLVYIILAAAAVSLALREYGDFGIILAVVAVDVILGFIQEYQAQRTYTALKGLLHPTTTVIRGGARTEIDVWELVPGDLVVLNAGEKAPGDGLLLESSRISANESILTGESEPVGKQAAGSDVFSDEGPDFGTAVFSEDRDTTVYMGTTILTGRGILRVVRTGTATELGKIAASLSEQSEEATPLQIRLRKFSQILTWIVSGFTAVILLIGVVMGREFFDMLRTSIILAIAAVPEGLLIAVTVILVLGMRKILRRQGLVKKLLAVETLGSVTVICTDKTGTLTEGLMRVSRTDFTDEARAHETMVFCNDLEGPVDVALWQYAGQHLSTSPQQLSGQSRRLAEELFSSETKRMITIVTGDAPDSSKICYLKGAPEIVLGMCDMPGEQAEEILRRVNEWAEDGLRLLGLAFRADGPLEKTDGYTWTGLVGMEDPVRGDVADSIRLARSAGIQVKMITGDYRKTAEKIASDIGLGGGGTLDGDEIAALPDADLREKVKTTSVFARIRPHDKFRIVNALQENGEVTAMIGDGVNDAPALKRSNIGVVVGSATDVARETADLILMDSHFSTIVAAIEEGRVIFENIRKVVAYTLSNSFAEVLTIFAAMVMKLPAPLMVAQILWIHLICDGPSDIVLGFEPKEYGVMEEKPRSLKEPILTKLSGILIAVISVSSAVFALYLFNHYYSIHQNIAEGRSIVFASFAINSMVYIFAYRSMRVPLFRMNRLTDNPPLIWAVLGGILTALAAFWIPALRELLGLVLLSAEEWGMVVLFAILLLAIVEAGKAIANRHAGKGPRPDRK